MRIRIDLSLKYDQNRSHRLKNRLCVQNMSLTEQLTKGVNYKTKQVSQPKAVKQSRSVGLKNTSLTEQLTKGVNYKTKQISRPKAVKQRGQRPKATCRSRSNIHPEGLPNARCSPRRGETADTMRPRSWWNARVR